jgi:hypothetical protein
MVIAKALATRQNGKMKGWDDTAEELTQLLTTVNLGNDKNGMGHNQIELAGTDPGFTF